MSTIVPSHIEPSTIAPPQDPAEELRQCQQAWLAILHVDQLECLLMGVFAPMLSFITLLVNSTAIAVLVHKSFRRTPSHIVLLSIFAVDMATAGIPMPFFIYFYSMGYFKSYLPFNACYLQQLIARLAPTISNTASIWLFTFLAIQRYLIVCKRVDGNASRLRTWAVSIVQRKTIHCIVAILISAVALHSMQIVDRYPTAISCPTKWDDNEQEVENMYDYDSGDSARSSTPRIELEPVLYADTCWLGSRFHETLPSAVSTWIYASYYVIRAIFIHLLPCCLVTMSTCSLIIEIRQANVRRRNLSMGKALRSTATAAVVSVQLDPLSTAKKKHSSIIVAKLDPVQEDEEETKETTPALTSIKQSDKEYSITSMLIVIMSVFLSVQVPHAVVYVWGILSGLGLFVKSPEASYVFELALKILNILYLMTFPIQSGLCFVMNRPFRQSFLCMLGLTVPPNNLVNNDRRPKK